ncbi:MAG: MerR family transcriptional regulator, partial [Massilia sp.]|nr:MerR family transcriptional regulator [Massilia sp.]
MKNTIEEQEVGGAVRGYRSGVAARLAGLAAATLRVWERRYRLTDAPRTANGQRLYTPEQVRRLGLLKQLVDQGHPIGTLAALPSARLRAMSGGQADGAHGVHGVYGAPGADGAIAVAAIGAGLLRRLASAIEDGLPLRLHDGAAGPAAVLLVELAEPDDTALASLRQARAANRAGAVIVLYRFCASATVRTLRADGFMVARFPGEMGELPLLCRAALQARCALPAAPVALDRAVRFDEATLAA